MVASGPGAAGSSPASFYWYDLETSGIHPASDRIVQFAGRRTDADLNPLDEPYSTYVCLAGDVLPSPEACLVTGITPQRANAEGLDEWRVLRAVDARLREPGTCVVGYNNLRFDDDFLRHGLYRNLMDPYAREWQNGNTRWDLIDVTRAVAALRPEGIRWPRDDGVVSFRLDRLSVANDIAHEGAHDARADVEATISLARLIKTAQPKLWHFALDQRFRNSALALLLPLGDKLCVHISSKYPSERYCAAPVVSVAMHPEIKNRIIVADLSRDVDALLEADARQLAESLFRVSNTDTAAAEANADQERPPLKAVVMNRCPFVAPIGVVREADAERLGFDFDLIEQRRRALAAAPGLADKIQEVYRRDAGFPASADAELGLYDGFIKDADSAAMDQLQRTLVSGAPWPGFAPGDQRLRTLGARLKARLFPDALNAAEQACWRDHVQHCLDEGFGGRPSLAAFQGEVRELLNTESDAQRRQVLEALASYEPAP